MRLREKMSPLSVSVIIPAYNCEKTIAETLRAVLKQDYSGEIEIIVVDDGSTDKTAEIVKSFPRSKYIRQDNAGPAKARNRGFKEAKGEVGFFTDSDCIPGEDWIKKAIVHLGDPSVGVVGGSYGIANEENLLARSIHKEIIFRHRHRMPEFSKSFGSYNFCVRKKIFEEVGGFNEGYPFASGEDNDLSYKILKRRYKIYFDKTFLVKHYHPENLRKYLSGQFRHGFFRVKMYFDHPAMSLGDDYTFWKDIFEPILVLFFLIGLIFIGTQRELFHNTAFLAFLFLVIIEFFYGWIITKNILEAIFFGCVMFFRSFAWTAGFLLGLPYFSFKKASKKIK